MRGNKANSGRFISFKVSVIELALARLDQTSVVSVQADNCRSYGAANSLMKNGLGRGERAHSLNLNHQWIDLMAMLLMRNDQSLVLHRRRTQLARAASPPAA